MCLVNFQSTMVYYTYKITNTVNGCIYVGVHKTKNPNDKYMGSGTVLKKAFKKYGLHNFKKEILKYHDSKETMYEHERKIVNYDFIKRTDTYNLKLGGEGGFDYVNSTMSDKDRQERSRVAYKAFQEKMKDPLFYMDWYTKLLESKRNK